MFRGADPAALDMLTVEVGRAAVVLAAARRTAPPAVASSIAGVERWLRHQEADLRLRSEALAGGALIGAGHGVLVIGRRVERGAMTTADLIVEAGQDAARRAGPLGPMIDDGGTIAAHAVEGVGSAIRRSSEIESRVLTVVGNRLRH